MSESAETFSVEIDCERLVADDQYINSHIELLSTNEERIHDVSLDNVWLSLWTFWFPSEFVFPLSNMLQLIEQENTFTLRLSNWLHDPDLPCSFEFFYEKTVVTWEVVGGGKEIITISLLRFAFPFKLFLVSFQVLHHQVLSRKLVVISKVIDFLMRLQMEMV